MVQKWENCGCPGAPYSMDAGPNGVYFGFSTRGTSSFAKASDPLNITAAPDSGNPRTRPMVATNKAGQILFAWTEMQDIVWQFYSKDGKPEADNKGRLKGAAAKWSNAAVIADSTGNFVLYYDGHDS